MGTTLRLNCGYVTLCTRQLVHVCVRAAGFEGFLARVRVLRKHVLVSMYRFLNQTKTSECLLLCTNRNLPCHFLKFWTHGCQLMRAQFPCTRIQRFEINFHLELA